MFSVKQNISLGLLYIMLSHLFFCSSGNQKNNYYQRESIPSYPQILKKEFISTKNINSSSYPLEASTSSYSNLKDAVENSSIPKHIYTEELLNSISYNYPKPKDGTVLGLYLEAAVSPWDTKRKLVHIGIYSPPEIKEEKEEKIDNAPKNIVFAVDTSGSMSGDDCIVLAKNSLKNFIQGLSEKDKVAIVQYTNDANIFLSPTSMRENGKILNSISRLKEGGGTNAWPGILLAYKVAREMKFGNQQTKIIIITDGDFGGVNNDEFLSTIERENKSGITISILGFGNRLQRVDTMDILSSTKKGEAFYIKSMQEAKRYLSLQTWSTWKSLAKDISVDVKFNPGKVESFRLVGFEKFNENKDKKSYEVSSPFSYTALYEITQPSNIPEDGELLTVKLNYKTSKGKSEEVKEILSDSSLSAWQATDNFRFAAGVAGLGMILNNSMYKGKCDYYMVIHLIQSALSYDPEGYRVELLSIVNKLKNF